MPDVPMKNTIKAIFNKFFEIGLFRREDHKYIILWKRNNEIQCQQSETIADLNMALYLYDLKKDDLEGN